MTEGGVGKHVTNPDVDLVKIFKVSRTMKASTLFQLRSQSLYLVGLTIRAGVLPCHHVDQAFDSVAALANVSDESISTWYLRPSLSLRRLVHWDYDLGPCSVSTCSPFLDAIRKPT